MPFCRRLVPIAVAAVFAAPVAAGAVNPPAIFPGTYVQVSPASKKPLPIGSSIVVIRAKSGRLGFSLNAVRALDSNQGFVAGSFAPGSMVVWANKSQAGDCKLTFTAVPGGLTVLQDPTFGDCGFGNGVTADGTYMLETEKPLPKT
jgi:hypothetical protein